MRRECYQGPVSTSDFAVRVPTGGLPHPSLTPQPHTLGLSPPSEVVLAALTEQAVLLAEVWLELGEESRRSHTQIYTQIEPSSSSSNASNASSTSSYIVLVALTGLTVLNIDGWIEGTKVWKLWLGGD